MPLPPPPESSAWELEDYRLWLGSIGWYGPEKTKEFQALLAAHRAAKPPDPTVKTPAEEREASVCPSEAYYGVLNALALWSPALVRWIDEQAPQYVRNLILLGAGRLWLKAKFALEAKRKFARKVPARVPPKVAAGVTGAAVAAAVGAVRATKEAVAAVPSVLERAAGVLALPLKFMEEERLQAEAFERRVEEPERRIGGVWVSAEEYRALTRPAPVHGVRVARGIAARAARR